MPFSSLEANSFFTHDQTLKMAIDDAIAVSLNTAKSGAVVLFHIENYATILDLYGSELAESLVQSAIQQLSVFLSPQDSIARLSLDDWGVLFVDMPHHHLADKVEAIRLALQKDKSVIMEDMYPLFLDVFVGGVDFPRTVQAAEEALQKAYIATKHAMGARYYGYMDYAQFLESRTANRVRLNDVHILQKAMAEDRLRLAYQPIVNSKTGKHDYYECLLRIANEKGELKSAGPHIIAAETMGLIDEIDHFVFLQVYEELKAHPRLKLSMNISGGGFDDNAAWLKAALQLLPSSPDVAKRLVIEVTETAFQRNLNKTAHFLKELRSLGCQLALDDFGVGYTSFRQLKTLALDIIKIDGTFVRGITSSKEDRLLIQAILEISRGFGLKSVAEFVETQAIADALVALDVDYLQGHHFSAAIPHKPWTMHS